MNVVKRAFVKNGWVCCPICEKKQFPLTGEEEIHNLKLRCKASNGKCEHFFLVNIEKTMDEKTV